jgi:hypothetical protein
MRDIEHAQHKAAEKGKHTGDDSEIQGKSDAAERAVGKTAYKKIGYVCPDNGKIKSRAVHITLPSWV